MPRIALLFIAAACLSACLIGLPPGARSAAAPQSPPPAPARAVGAGSRFGVNLERLASWSRSRVYIDAARTAFGFDTIEHPRDGRATVGQGGLPTGDFGLLVIEGAPPSMAGVYHVVFPGTVREIRATGLKVTGQTFDADAGVTRAEVDFRTGLNNNLNLQFVGAALRGRVKVLRPGYTEAKEAEQVFTDEFLNMVRALSPGVIRGMDFLAVNSNPVEKWQDRPTHDTPLYSETAGRGHGAGPVEDLIDICNRVGADLWLNVPVAADADYRQHLADLTAGKLKPGLRVYVEYGNENWNSSFSQHKLNVAAAGAARAADGYDADDEVAGLQRTAAETARLGKLFRAAFDRRGPSKGSGQGLLVRPVLCGQGANLDTLQIGLKYLSGHVGPSTGSGQGRPSEVLYGIAVAPYAAMTPDTPVNDWHVRLLGGKHVTAFCDLAKSFGVASCCYESGVDLSGGHIDAAAQKDPRMEAVMNAYWAAWKGTGPVLHYNLCSDAGTGTPWGLTDDAADLTQPKFKAAVRFAAAARVAR